mgnify:CR=1 FL=1
MMIRSATLASALSLTACVSWQQGASSLPLACAADEIRITQPRSGAITDRWQASCRGFSYRCSAPAGVEDHSTPDCVLLSEDPQPARITPLWRQGG